MRLCAPDSLTPDKVRLSTIADLEIQAWHEFAPTALVLPSSPAVLSVSFRSPPLSNIHNIRDWRLASNANRLATRLTFFLVLSLRAPKKDVGEGRLPIGSGSHLSFALSTGKVLLELPDDTESRLITEQVIVVGMPEGCRLLDEGCRGALPNADSQVPTFAFLFCCRFHIIIPEARRGLVLQVKD